FTVSIARLLWLFGLAAYASILMFDHLMTRSALASTFGGITRPMCFAAFRLMMSSNFLLLNRQLSGLGAFQNLDNIRSRAAVQVGQTRAVGHKPTIERVL